MDTFGSTFGIQPQNIYDFNEVFPHHKLLFDVIDLYATNSTLDVPVHVVGLNAVGKIGNTQRNRLAQLIESQPMRNRFRVLACHHHPLTIPYKPKPDIVEEFLIMRDARSFIRVCFEHRIDIMLHGHKHLPFIWKSQIIPELDPPHSITVVSAGSPTHVRSGSSQVYNKYLVIRKTEGNTRSVQEVTMHSRRYDPKEEQFVPCGDEVKLYLSPQQQPSKDVPPRGEDGDFSQR